jgi:hypothetical protein
LRSYDARSSDFFGVAFCIFNYPVAVYEAYGRAGLICDSDSVGEEKVGLFGTAVFRDVLRDDLDTNPPGEGIRIGHERFLSR